MSPIGFRTYEPLCSGRYLQMTSSSDVEIKLFFPSFNLAMLRNVSRYYDVFLVFTTFFSRNYEKSFSLLREDFSLLRLFFLVITTFFS